MDQMVRIIAQTIRLFCALVNTHLNMHVMRIANAMFEFFKNYMSLFLHYIIFSL